MSKNPHWRQRVECTLCLLCFTAIGAGSSGISVLPFDTSEIPTRAAEGRIVNGIKWQDRHGINYVVVARKDTGVYFENGWREDLYAYQLTRTDTGLQCVWQIHDFSPTRASKIGYYDSTLRVLDVDHDGVGEPRFFYALIRESEPEVALKYILHRNGKKLAIRGSIPMELDTTYYTKTLDPAFKQEPPQVRKFASDDWDAFVHSTFPCFTYFESNAGANSTNASPAPQKK